MFKLRLEKDMKKLSLIEKQHPLEYYFRDAISSYAVLTFSLRVSGVYQDGAGEFARRRPRLAGRLLRIAEKLAGNDRPRSNLSIGPGSDDAVGSRRRSLGDSPKGSRSSLGTRREITGRRPEDLS
ncbi:hypothetical protein GW17_00022880 [Ensete ventricosum]|nr:hypothetical protein GW17_00022880 [Ensete ventricosum]